MRGNVLLRTPGLAGRGWPDTRSAPGSTETLPVDLGLPPCLPPGIRRFVVCALVPPLGP